MKNLNLVVMFRLSNDDQMRIKEASRITLDGRGSLMLYDASGAPETIDLRKVRSISIQPLNAASYLPAA